VALCRIKTPEEFFYLMMGIQYLVTPLLFTERCDDKKIKTLLLITKAGCCTHGGVTPHA
jgi:hypothetical protein